MSYIEEINEKKRQINQLNQEIQELQCQAKKELSWYEIYQAIYSTLISDYRQQSSAPKSIRDELVWRDELEATHMLHLKRLRDRLFPELKEHRFSGL